MPIIIEAGARFGRWTVVSAVGSRGGKLCWSCRCDCGGAGVVRGTDLRASLSLSCGCRTREAVSAANTVHGETDSPAFRSWHAMRQRCAPDSRVRDRYFDRGITVCDRWALFSAFLSDMGRPGPGQSIDRIDNDRGYSPDNCRWATATTQARNRRGNLPITAFGETRVLSAWGCDSRCTVSPQTVSKRLRKGWTAEAAIAQPAAR